MRIGLKKRGVSQWVTGKCPDWIRSIEKERTILPQRPIAAKRVIGRQLAVGFALVSVLATFMYGLLLALVGDVSLQIRSMREDEGALRQSMAIAVAIREQYIHLAHGILEKEPSHRSHIENVAATLRKNAKELRRSLPAEGMARLDFIQRKSQEMMNSYEKILTQALLKNSGNEGNQSLRRIRGELQKGAEAADALARMVETRMVRAHISATKATNLTLVLGGLCVLLVFLLSLAFTLRLKQSLLKPLEDLAETARTFGAGNFASRAGKIGQGEILSLAKAFDHMAEELQKRERRIVETERMAAIGQLAAGVAHEINNPIGIIRGYLKTMGPDMPPETLREELKILDEEAAQCQRIADDLLSYVRIPVLTRESLDAESFLERCISRFKDRNRSHRFSLQVRPGKIFADPGRLRQVVFNLLQNAVQASEEGGWIQVEGRSCKNGYEILVLDRGNGVPPEDESRIFEPFFSRRSGGSGLGLSVCHGLVSSHGGTLEYKPREGGGSCFRIYLPAARIGEDIK